MGPKGQSGQLVVRVLSSWILLAIARGLVSQPKAVTSLAALALGPCPPGAVCPPLSINESQLVSTRVSEEYRERKRIKSASTSRCKNRGKEEAQSKLRIVDVMKVGWME
jgi:hypothetical protein